MFMVMALPSRLKSALRPVIQATHLTGPTTVGVLLSVGAHVLLLAFGPRTAFSFKALTQAAQAADAQETIVPLVQLTPAEQNRLPNFAQPQLPANLNGLSSLALPPGLPLVPNAKIPTAQSRSLTGNRLANSPLTRNSLTNNQLRQLEAGRISQGFRLGTTFPTSSLGDRTSSTLSLGNRQAVEVPVLPPPPPTNSSAPTESANASPALPANGSEPAAPSASDLLPQLDPNQETISFGEAIARANAQPNPGANAGTNPPDIGDRIPATDSPNAAQTPAENSSAIARAPSQGGSSQLAQDFVYNSADVSEEAAKQNAAEWLQATAEGKGEDITQASTDLSIDSDFKVCQENPPVDALIGVVVNPDGTQTDVALLKRTGYPVLDRKAIAAVSYADFDTATVPTQYQVNIDVLYSPQGCVDSLPDSSN